MFGHKTMKHIILLGAGASVDAGVPDATGMTKRILDSFKSSAISGKYYHVLCFAIGGLLFQRGVNGLDPFDGANIEDVFNAIDLLGNRLELEAAPFIGSWHPLIDELDVIRVRKSTLINTAEQMNRRSAADRLNRDLERMIKGERPFNSIGETVTEMIQGRRFQPTTSIREDEPTEMPGKGRLFRETNEYMIRKLVALTWIRDAAKVAYLQPLVRSAVKHNTVIATLNYDNVVELAATSCNLSTDTGITRWSEAGTLAFDSTALSLLKLHGSIDWRLDDKPPDDTHPLPSQVVKTATREEMEKGKFRPAVVFGGRNKLTASGPFLDILRTFQDALFQADALTIIGYSFSDEHINEYIRQWINSSTSRTVRIVTLGTSQSRDGSFAGQMRSLKQRVTVFSDGATAGIKELFGQDE